MKEDKTEWDEWHARIVLTAKLAFFTLARMHAHINMTVCEMNQLVNIHLVRNEMKNNT